MVTVTKIIVDAAHGHSKMVLNTLSKLKKINKKIPLYVGNVATGVAAKNS